MFVKKKEYSYKRERESSPHRNNIILLLNKNNIIQRFTFVKKNTFINVKV